MLDSAKLRLFLTFAICSAAVAQQAYGKFHAEVNAAMGITLVAYLYVSNHVHGSRNAGLALAAARGSAGGRPRTPSATAHKDSVTVHMN